MFRFDERCVCRPCIEMGLTSGFRRLILRSYQFALFCDGDRTLQPLTILLISSSDLFRVGDSPPTSSGVVTFDELGLLGPVRSCVLFRLFLVLVSIGSSLLFPRLSTNWVFRNFNSSYSVICSPFNLVSLSCCNSSSCGFNGCNFFMASFLLMFSAVANACWICFSTKIYCFWFALKVEFISRISSAFDLYSYIS